MGGVNATSNGGEAAKAKFPPRRPFNLSASRAVLYVTAGGYVPVEGIMSLTQDRREIRGYD